MTAGEVVRDDAKRMRDLRRRVSNARNFPTNTCPASRHLHLMADALSKGKPYHMLTDEPEHCAESIYAVIAALWETRTELEAARKALVAASA